MLKILSYTLEAEIYHPPNSSILNFKNGSTTGEGGQTDAAYEVSILPNDKVISFVSSLINHFTTNIQFYLTMPNILPMFYYLLRTLKNLQNVKKNERIIRTKLIEKLR
jgi:hypothetical protein